MQTDYAPPPPRMLLPDALWAPIFAMVSIGYLLVSIALSTSFFLPNGGPTLEASRVWGTVAIFALQAVPLLWRTRHPTASFWAVFTAFVAAVLVLQDRNLTVSASLTFAIFTVAAYTPARTWGVSIAAAATIDFGLHLAYGIAQLGKLSALLVLLIATRVIPTYVAPLLGGLLYAAVRRRAELASARARLAAERNEALKQAADAQTEAAIAAERNRMARELHDVAAHHLSGILLQTRAAIRVQRSDPAVAAELLDGVRVEGELALDNLRDVIGVLRDTDDEASRTEPTLSGLPELIDSVRSLHPAIEVTVRGLIDDLSPATSLACFRIIQESLTNARKHAPGADVVVSVDRLGGDLVIEVMNGPSGAAQPQASHRGYGLMGMRERATMVGGSLETGHTPQGGWSTRAVVPVDRRVRA